jgi:DNA polymerase III alpha subunit
MIPLFKSCYSISKSILTLDPPKDLDDGPDSIFSLAISAGLKDLYLVEDSMASCVTAYETSKGICKLNFGFRTWISANTNIPFKEDDSINKIIIFIKNYEGYKRMIKIATSACVDNFDIEPRLSYETMLKHWNDDDLLLAIPFYDSFIHQNLLTKNTCLPTFNSIPLTMFVEDNDLPFDKILDSAVRFFAGDKYEIVPTKSIYYNKREDFLAWQTLKLINRKGHGSGYTLEDPNLDHCSSREFSFESWTEKQKQK